MTKARALPGTVRIRRAPPCEPPYDDERPPDWPALDPWQPPLDFSISSTRPERPRVTGRAAGPLLSPPATAPASPDTRAAVQRFLVICVEVLNGFRPAHHLRALSDPLAAVTVIEAMTEATRQVRRSASRVRVRKVRLCEPRPGAVEIAAVLAVDASSPPVLSARTSSSATDGATLLPRMDRTGSRMPGRPSSPRPNGAGSRNVGSRRGDLAAADRPTEVGSAAHRLATPAQAWALACRLEQRNGRWRCVTAHLL